MLCRRCQGRFIQIGLPISNADHGLEGVATSPHKHFYIDNSIDGFMSRRKGYNVKEMDDLILVDGEEVRDWMKVRKNPEFKETTPQQERFKEYGRLVKEECGSVKGDADKMRACQSRIREKVFGKKKK